MPIRYVVYDGCPVPQGIARRLKVLKKDVPSARLNSGYRGEQAAGLLHKLGKHTQGELYDGFRRGLPGYLPANPPGFSSHELRSDGNSFFGKPRGARLPWWQCGLDFNDQDIPKLIRAAKKHGWDLRQPYTSGPEYHHLNFAKKPRLKLRPRLPENLVYVLRARKAGAKYAWRIIRAAKAEGVQFSLAFALVEQETGFRNVFGHDPTIFKGAGKVTKAKYLAYKRQRGPQGRGGMQGVGPCQLTWWSTQDAADAAGGCWKPGVNIRIGLHQLAQNIKQHGELQGIAAYNGSGPAAQRYAAQVEQKQQRWHHVLLGGKS
jgi:hypothetical protein